LTVSEISEEEIAVYREWVRILDADLPIEWQQEECEQLIRRLERLRDREGEMMVKAEGADDVAEFEERRMSYEALATALPEAES
jgi:hypothetical protein